MYVVLGAFVALSVIAALLAICLPDEEERRQVWNIVFITLLLETAFFVLARFPEFRSFGLRLSLLVTVVVLSLVGLGFRQFHIESRRK